MWGKGFEDLHDLIRDFVVARHTHGEKDGIGTAARRGPRGHAGVNAILASFV